MRNFLFYISIGLVFVAGLGLESAHAQKDELFKITRNKDAHEIIYHLNTDARGQLDKKKPIEAYWIRYDLEGTGRSLNAFERRYAYGLNFHENSPEEIRFTFVSFSRDLFLRRISRNQYEVQVEMNGERVKLNEIYLHMSGGSFWFPKINYIELRAQNAEGEPITEVIENP